jgi:hypothetical protein
MSLPILVLYGPSGSGKTRFALTLVNETRDRVRRKWDQAVLEGWNRDHFSIRWKFTAGFHDQWRILAGPVLHSVRHRLCALLQDQNPVFQEKALDWQREDSVTFGAFQAIMDGLHNGKGVIFTVRDDEVKVKIEEMAERFGPLVDLKVEGLERVEDYEAQAIRLRDRVGQWFY